LFSSFCSGENDEDLADIPDFYSDPSNLEPKMGQLFKEEIDGYLFYNLYARFKGFGIRRSMCHKNKKSGVKTMQEFCCIREACTLILQLCFVVVLYEWCVCVCCLNLGLNYAVL
jgi:hypothetical protein